MLIGLFKIPIPEFSGYHCSYSLFRQTKFNEPKIGQKLKLILMNCKLKTFKIYKEVILCNFNV